MDSTMEPRRIGRSILDVAVASPLLVTAPLWRRWQQRWGATDEEVRGPMPGDDILAKPSFNATRAVTIKAPPERVWPWIAQIGDDRVGFYSYDLFDHGARPSARSIVPEFQQLKVDDWVAMYSKVNDATAFRVRALVPPAWLLWTKPDSTWAWKLVPIDGGRATRLVTRLKARYEWRVTEFGAAVAGAVGGRRLPDDATDASPAEAASRAGSCRPKLGHRQGCSRCVAVN